MYVIHPSGNEKHLLETEAAERLFYIYKLGRRELMNVTEGIGLCNVE
jgi:hypothetical protein